MLNMNTLQKVFLIIIINLMSFSVGFAQGKGVGLGVMLGQPTGISAKVWVSTTSAFALGTAYSFKDKAMEVQADYLLHLNHVFPLTTGKIPVYIGIGGTVSFKNNNQDPNYGIRVPVGISYFIPTVPVDVFIEAVPVIGIKPESRVSLNGNIGVRYFF